MAKKPREVPDNPDDSRNEGDFAKFFDKVVAGYRIKHPEVDDKTDTILRAAAIEVAILSGSHRRALNDKNNPDHELAEQCNTANYIYGLPTFAQRVIGRLSHEDPTVESALRIFNAESNLGKRHRMAYGENNPSLEGFSAKAIIAVQLSFSIDMYTRALDIMLKPEE